MANGRNRRRAFRRLRRKTPLEWDTAGSFYLYKPHWISY